MAKEKLKIAQVLSYLDKWSDETIKNSLIVRLFTKLKNTFKTNKRHDEISNIFYLLTIFSILSIFILLSMPFFANDRSGIGILILISFTIFSLYLFINQKAQITYSSIDFLVIVFLLIALISTFHSYFLSSSIIGFIKYFIFIIFYFICKITLQNTSTNILRIFCFILFSTVTLISLYGIYQYFIEVPQLATWEDKNVENIHSRVYSTLGNPNLLAGYLLIFLPLFGSFLLLNNCKPITKYIISIGCTSIITCLFLTGSRGAYLGLIAGIIALLFIFILYIFKNKNVIKNTNKMKLIFILFVSTLLILALILGFPIFLERLKTIFLFWEHSSNSYRLNVWLSAINMLKDNWLLGIGPGNETFRLAYGLYMRGGYEALSAYNIFAEIAIEIGVFGLISFLGIIFISLLKLHYLFWNSKNTFAIGIVISLVVILFHGMTDTVFFRPQIFIPFWFLIALIGKLEYRTADKG